jgi:hypothetical protein
MGGFDWAESVETPVEEPAGARSEAEPVTEAREEEAAGAR